MDRQRLQCYQRREEPIVLQAWSEQVCVGSKQVVHILRVVRPAGGCMKGTVLEWRGIL